MESNDYEELQNVEEMEISELLYDDTRWQENAWLYSRKWRDCYRRTTGYSIDLRDSNSYDWFVRVINEPEFLTRMREYDVRAHPENLDKPIMAYLSTHESLKWICEKVCVTSSSFILIFKRI